MNSEVNLLGSHLSEEFNVTTVLACAQAWRSVTHKPKVKLRCISVLWKGCE
jgi:hypothetical protein